MVRVSPSRWLWLALLVLVLALAACGGKDEPGGEDVDVVIVTAEVTEDADTTGQFNPNLSGPGLAINTGGDRQLPGCNDPNDDECPMPLDLDLDGTVSGGGITISYPTRYFNAATGDDNPAGVPIEITPNERYNFAEEANFQIYFDDSVEVALSELDEPLTAEWSTNLFEVGTIGVVRDREQEPPVNTIIGAFPLDGEQGAVVVKLVVTGKYGWDLFSRTYDAMLETLTVDFAEATVEPAE